MNKQFVFASFIILLLCISIPFIYANGGGANTSYSFSEGLSPYYDASASTYGYIDKTGKIVIKAAFYHAGAFHEGLAVVQTEWDSYQIIDKTGKVVFGPQKGEIQDFSEGMAAVWFGDEKNGSFNYIDKTGKVVIKTAYKTVYGFSEGLALVRPNDKTSAFIDTTGKLAFTVDGTCYSRFSEGLAVAFKNKTDRDLYGYIDKTGAFVIPPQFFDATPFKNGRAFVVTKTAPYAVIDKTGAIVETLKTDLVIDLVGSYGEDLFVVSAQNALNGRYEYGFINTKGKIVINLWYEDAHPFSEGLAAVQANGKVGFIDKTGKMVIAPQFDVSEGGY